MTPTLLVVLLSAFPGAEAASVSPDKLECAKQLYARDEAFKAGDWAGVLAAAAAGDAPCQRILSDGDAARVREDAAFARARRGEPKEALAEAGRCLARERRRSMCHALKAQALFDLGRKDEAAASIAAAEKLQDERFKELMALPERGLAYDDVDSEKDYLLNVRLYLVGLRAAGVGTGASRLTPKLP